MREILFRGKQLTTGKWIYGFYEEELNSCVDKIFPCIISRKIKGSSTNERCSCCYESRVSSETVGQYTGFNDRYGKRIFEGDIVSIKIRFINNVRKKITVRFLDGAFNVNSEIIEMNDAVVIGNIYDNPELMEVQDV